MKDSWLERIGRIVKELFFGSEEQIQKRDSKINPPRKLPGDSWSKIGSTEVVEERKQTIPYFHSGADVPAKSPNKTESDQSSLGGFFSAVVAVVIMSQKSREEEKQDTGENNYFHDAKVIVSADEKSSAEDTCYDQGLDNTQS